MFLSRELNSFISFAEEKSIKVAAEHFNSNPHAVSNMLKKRENELGMKLFKYKNGSIEMSIEAIVLCEDLSNNYY